MNFTEDQARLRSFERELDEYKVEIKVPYKETKRLKRRDWKKIESFIGTKTVLQIRSQAQRILGKSRSIRRESTSPRALRKERCFRIRKAGYPTRPTPMLSR